MNCQEFAAMVTDLAREQELPAGVRERALAHAGACGRCAAGLAGERNLSSALLALAAATERQGAPQNVEAELRAAFRRQSRPLALVQALPFEADLMLPGARGASQPLEPAPARRWSHWATGVAASILVVLALTGALLRRGVTPPSRPTNRGWEAPPAPPGHLEPPQEARKQTAPSYAQPSHIVTGKRRVPVARGGQREIVTEFLPLPGGEDLNPMESRHLVRVRLPRAALKSFGLPVNEERGGERISADVLVGEDGVARAIRFVR